MTTIPIFPNLKSFADRFWSKVVKSKNPDGCWEWIGGFFKHPRTREKTYGCFSVGKKSQGTSRMIPAHHVSWFLKNGQLPEGMKILHKCDNTACVRDDHLIAGTQAENVADMIAKGRGWWQRKAA